MKKIVFLISILALASFSIYNPSNYPNGLATNIISGDVSGRHSDGTLIVNATTVNSSYLNVNTVNITQLQSNRVTTNYIDVYSKGVGSIVTPNINFASNSGVYGYSGVSGLSTAGSWYAQLNGSGVFGTNGTLSANQGIISNGGITANSLSISQGITVNALKVNGNITATSYYGDGSNLTGISGTAINGSITLTGNITAVNGTFSGTVSASALQVNGAITGVNDISSISRILSLNMVYSGGLITNVLNANNMNIGYNSNNSLIPKMTTWNYPIGKITSDTNNSSYPNYQAFDGDTSTSWIGGVNTGWITYDFGYNIVVNSYKIYPRNVDRNYDPATFAFYGSLDNSTFVTLDSQLTAIDWAGSTPKQYTATNNIAYRYYKFMYFSTSIGGQPALVNEVLMFGNKVTSNIEVTGTSNFATLVGNVGIGTTAPSTKLEVAGTVSANTLVLSTLPAANETALYVSATGVVSKATSSKRYKTNINQLDIDSSKVLLVEPKSWNYIKYEDEIITENVIVGTSNIVASKTVKKEVTGQHNIGPIAEDVEEVLPELVNHDLLGRPESLKDSQFIWLILEELKKLKSKVDAL